MLTTISFSSVVVLEVALLFLGVGVQTCDTSLDVLLGEGRDYLIAARWLAAIPTVAIIVVTMAIALLGDWLRSVFDRRLSA